MVSARWLVVAGLVAFAACQFRFDPEGAGCDAQGRCPAGFRCVDAVCRALGPDASVGDGGGLVDAGVCDCSNPQCEGRVCRAATSACDRAEVCTAGQCPLDRVADAGALCAQPACQPGARAGERRCDAQGLCLPPAVQSCDRYGCDVDTTTCRTSCTEDAHCAPGHFCAAGQCRVQLDNGIACMNGAQCSSGHCVDGVCCNTACEQPCDACAEPGVEGTCSLRARGAFPPAPGCDGGALCDGAMALCPTGCTSDDGCSMTSYCKNQQFCAPRKANGEACSAGNQCASTFCADGVCCDTACDEGCDECATGTCTVAAAASPGTRPSCAPFLCNGVTAACPTQCQRADECAAGAPCLNSLCGGSLGNGQSCVGRDAGDCGSGNCVDGVCCDSSCGGECDRCDLVGAEGTCTGTPGATVQACGLFRCPAIGAACPTSCTIDDDCVSGHFCDGSACVPVRRDGAECSRAAQCLSSTCVPFYVDADGDGFGPSASVTQRCGSVPPSGFVTLTGDCCDSEAEAYPGQTAFFSRARATCGGYDFDCSGPEELERTAVGSQCAVNSASADPCDLGCASAGSVGWLVSGGASVPACGETGPFFSGCTQTMNPGSQCPFEIDCQQDIDGARAQRCR